ncbi:hypothetical protein [Brumimicrobium mesophilum]|uniref:hypothetical protein n=1 Tax=Brumimicrobium mesophilum TaxID=392717 RepID=UPI000D142A05|nr:hypothetical protein [Brumimicrobium mesophilum]
MKKLLTRFLLFLAPIAIIVLPIAYFDFFQVFGFPEYHLDQRTAVNRGTMTTKTYIHLREEEKYDSFLFGSSRSHAFKCENWKEHLPKDAKPLHFDASAEGIWGILKKMQFINENGDSIKNALVILDRHGLSETRPRDGVLFIAMPEISKGSYVKYYSEFLKASLYPKFLLAYIDYAIFKKHREYMGNFINTREYPFLMNRKNGDIWYGYDREIEEDSLGYYKDLIEQGVFYERPKPNNRKPEVTKEEIEQLKLMKELFVQHNTNYKIVLSPIYDQVPVEQDQIDLLNEIFGSENIFNFSGKNSFTEPIHNFYETSHFRPHVANEIMEIIYQ